MLAGMLCTVEPAVCLRVSKARLIGVSSTRCWRGGLIEGVTGGVTGGSCTGYGLPAVLRVHVQARVHGSSSYVSGAKQGYVGVVGAGALGSSTRMTTGRGGVTCLRGDTCRLGVVALPLRGCSFRLERRLVAVTIMSP